jgi:hypothetical protein
VTFKDFAHLDNMILSSGCETEVLNLNSAGDKKIKSKKYAHTFSVG